MSDLLPIELREECAPLAGHPEHLIHVLRRVQETVGFISPDSEAFVSDLLGVTLSRVHGVVTFYHLFYTEPRGRHTVRLCRGTACHVGGAGGIQSALEEHLGIKPGETTEDLAVTLETVACLGACALAPVMVVDEGYHGKLTAAEAVAIVDRTLSGEAEAG